MLSCLKTLPPQDSGHLDGIQGDKLLEQVLQPSRECVQETLSLISTSPLTDIVATYFDHSEQTFRLCILLYQKVHQARLAYAPIHDLVNNLLLEFDSDSYLLSDSQCNLAYNVFLQFDRLENPFISNASQNFDDMRQRFSQLTHELNHHPVKPRPRATNALVALAGSPICFALFPSNMIKKEKGDIVLLDKASRSAFVLRRDLDTIDRLVAHLYDDVEYDMFSIHHALDREMDKYLIQQVLKQLQRNRPSFIERLTYLEGNLLLCFDAIKQTRSCILQKIHPHQLLD
ncbi:UPF0496 protein At3g19330-like isoform X2 [Salvia hispanica]|uniref:UPF0496 protein At3g19330-like isoform X2 n=1 Tax=Salvia hispanica TaxID=49212 RepID=UPI0020097246|nr:UPF0496 protein At3g19330-like isoform X2 [Salvia hispanica]